MSTRTIVVVYNRALANPVRHLWLGTIASTVYMDTLHVFRTPGGWEAYAVGDDWALKTTIPGEKSFPAPGKYRVLGAKAGEVSLELVGDPDESVRAMYDSMSVHRFADVTGFFKATPGVISLFGFCGDTPFIGYAGYSHDTAYLVKFLGENPGNDCHLCTMPEILRLKRGGCKTSAHIVKAPYVGIEVTGKCPDGSYTLYYGSTCSREPRSRLIDIDAIRCTEPPCIDARVLDRYVSIARKSYAVVGDCVLVGAYLVAWGSEAVLVARVGDDPGVIKPLEVGWGASRLLAAASRLLGGSALRHPAVHEYPPSVFSTYRGSLAVLDAAELAEEGMSNPHGYPGEEPADAVQAAALMIGNEYWPGPRGGLCGRDWCVFPTSAF